MTTVPTLRGTCRADLLAIPSFIYEFQVTESVVVLAMQGNIVAFSARLDANWFIDGFDQIADQVLNATAQIDHCHYVLLGFSSDPEFAMVSVTEVADVLGRDLVIEALVTDGTHYWSLIDGEGPVPIDLEASPITAQAVYDGVNIHSSREEAVAPVTTWHPPAPEEVANHLTELDRMSAEERMQLQQGLVESDPPVDGADALTLACLLGELDEGAAEVIAQLSMTTAGRMWPNLVAARQVAPEFAQTTVVALLGLASWLAGRGPQATSCAEQVHDSDPHHPIGGLLTRIHALGIPPRRWDR